MKLCRLTDEKQGETSFNDENCAMNILKKKHFTNVFNNSIFDKSNLISILFYTIKQN